MLYLASSSLKSLRLNNHRRLCGYSSRQGHEEAALRHSRHQGSDRPLSGGSVETEAQKSTPVCDRANGKRQDILEFGAVHALYVRYLDSFPACADKAPY